MSMGQSTQTQQQNQKTDPWAPQQGFLLDAWNKASGLYGQHSANGYNGPVLAGFTPEQMNTFKSMVGAGGDTSVPDWLKNSGMSLGNAGGAAATGALDQLGSFRPTGGVDTNIAEAQKYANNPAIDGMIDASMHDARRQVSEQALPQVARAAALTGNIGSSKRGIAEGLIQRGLADKTADVSSNMRGQMFDNGLQMAESGRQFNNNAMMDAMKSRLSGGLSAAGQGASQMGASLDARKSLFDMANMGGQGLQDATQRGYDAERGQTEYGQDRMWQLLQQMYGIQGSANWGGQSSGSSTTTNNPSMFNQIGGLLGAGGSLKYLLSDRRVKKDIEQVGELSNGLKVYRFRYTTVPDSPVFIGLMAQEVENVIPDAVREFDGIKHVNYDLATRGTTFKGDYDLKWSR